MWNAPNGHTTFTGPLAFLLAQGIWAITSDLEAAFEYDDEFCDYGHPAFDRLTNEQKAWTLHKVAFGLLDRKTEVVHLMAYLEATVATVFRQIEVDLDVEIQMAEEEPDDDCFSLRRAALAAYEKVGGNSPEMLMEDEEPLRVECDDFEEWKTVIEILEETVLWDADYDLDNFDDMPSKESKELKHRYGILDDYFTAIPDDPKPNEALKLLEKTRKLCERVCAREQKRMSK